MKSLEKEIPSQSPVLLEREVGVTKVGFCQYSYGSADIRRIPILRSSKFVFIDGKACDSVASAISERSVFKRTDVIILPTNIGQVFLATLYGMFMPAKLRLMKSQANVTFHVPNKLVLSRSELVMVAMAWEIADELYSFSGEHLRIKQLYNDVKGNCDAYLPNGHTVLRGLKLITKELEKRAACIEIASMTQHVREVKDVLKEISDILVMAGVNAEDYLELPSLEILHAQKCVGCCHQHFVDEKKWDLTVT